MESIRNWTLAPAASPPGRTLVTAWRGGATPRRHGSAPGERCTTRPRRRPPRQRDQRRRPYGAAVVRFLLNQPIARTSIFTGEIGPLTMGGAPKRSVTIERRRTRTRSQREVPRLQ